jgi:heat shock protein HslJ
MRVGLVVVVVMALASLLGACTSAGAAPSPSTPVLAGRMFLSTAVTAGGKPKPLVAGTRIRLAFDAAGLNAQAGCNTMSGPYQVVGGALQVGQLATTAMGCDPDRHAQDESLATFLTFRPSVVLSPTALTLEGGGTAVTFVDREIAEPDAPLVGTTWHVESLFQGDTVSSLADVEGSLVFGADGRVAVNTGCNTGSASYEVVGTAGAIRIGGIALTKRACQGAAGEVEQLMIRVLSEQTVASTINGPVLELRVNGFGLGLRAT